MSVFKGFFGTGGGAEEEAGLIREEGFESGITDLEAARSGSNLAFDPFTQAGTSALQQESAALGLGPPGSQEEFFRNFKDSPGQAFLRDRQERSLLRNQAAIGGLRGGNVRTALQEQAAGFAEGSFQDRLNRISSVAGRGLDAVGRQQDISTGLSRNIADFRVGGKAAVGAGIEAGAAARRSALDAFTGVAKAAAGAAG